MVDRLPARQRPEEIIDVAEWEPDDEFPYLPIGQKPKRVLICPNPAPKSYLVGGHRYLFKEPRAYAAQQIWSEVIASRLASAAGVDVPPAFLGFDTKNGSCGVLIEYFYGHGERYDRRFVHARDRFQAVRIALNEKRGSLRDNISLSRLHRVPDAWSWWARTIAFDAMIGNTDRHSQNWGFLVRQAYGEEPSYELAPAFDNGTSLGFIVREEELASYLDPAKLRRHVERGSHHYGWLEGDDASAKHVALCGLLRRIRGGVAGDMAKVLGVSDAGIEGIVQSCVDMGYPVPFSEGRAYFVVAQTKARRDALVRALGD